MSNLKTHKRLIREHKILSDQMTKKRLEVILRQLEETLLKQTPGEIVEFGCYSGTTSLFIRRLLDEHAPDRQFHVYDSFGGLPQKSIEDASVAGTDFKAGELKASKRDLVKNFRKQNLKLPVIHKCWFADLKSKDVPAEISFGFLDGDFYHSILDSLELVWPRLSQGGTVVIDDFGKSNLPGVTRAVDDYFKAKANFKIKHEQDLAIIEKY